MGRVNPRLFSTLPRKDQKRVEEEGRDRLRLLGAWLDFCGVEEPSTRSAWLARAASDMASAGFGFAVEAVAKEALYEAAAGPRPTPDPTPSSDLAPDPNVAQTTKEEPRKASRPAPGRDFY